MTDYLTELKRAIKETHGVTAVHGETVYVKEIFRGEVAWQGEVEVFMVFDHPQVNHCFAWGDRREDDKGWDVTTVLGVPPITTPELAVKAAIAAYAKQQTPPR